MTRAPVPEPLVLHCAHPNAAAEDGLQVYPDPDPDPALRTIVLENIDSSNQTLTWLDEHQARELFNWLGVWLHGGK